MEDMFLKSAFPAQDSALGDTSLALPAEPTTGSSSKPGSNDRSFRVHQQVKLTLSRKARKTVPNGGVHLENIKAKSSDVIDGSSPQMKVNGLGFANCSFSSSHVQRPLRRLEVSPQQTPELPRSSYTTPRYGSYRAYNIAEHRVGPPLDYSLGSDSFRRYAFSEVPRGTRLYASAPSHRAVRQRTSRQTSGGEYGFRWSYNPTAVKQEKHISRRQSDMAVGAIQPDDELSWLAQIRRNGQGLRRLHSSPPSVASIEVDRGRQVEVDFPVQQIRMRNISALKSENKPPEMTLHDAVKLLSHKDEETLICAASYIQNLCFNSADAKIMVCHLHGIEMLLQLLRNENEEVQRVAAGALRNAVFQNNDNKMVVNQNNGLAIILEELKSSRDMETRRQLTGLLWNLSSHDVLKECLTIVALPVLTESVLVPCSGLSEGANPKDELLSDDDVFYHATGCLRNLSSAGPVGRSAMRDCKNLIDSLVFYIRGTIDDRKTDDKSTENCICILHNLSYQIEEELPLMCPPRKAVQNLTPKQKVVGCFSSRSTKITEDLEQQSPLLEEKANPSGKEWLWSPITIRMYLSLIARSVSQFTQEAAIGALQNMTAGKKPISEAIAFTIVKRENGLRYIEKMLKEGESDVKKTATSLLKNLSRYPKLQPEIIKQLLPQIVEMLSNDNTGTDLPAEAKISLCDILTNLSQNNPQPPRLIANEGALQRIVNISSYRNGCEPTKANQAARILLCTMWKHKELHAHYNKLGFSKSDFINATTW